jgi:ASC-1-like (ASCH) protein
VKFFCNDVEHFTTVTGLRRYSSFQEMLKNEDIQKLLPGHNYKSALDVYREIYPDEKVKAEGGVLVIEVAPPSK